MKTQPLKRNADGSYDGPIAGEHALTAQEQRKVREVLSTGPVYVSAIADQCGVARTNPVRFDALCKFIDHLGQHTLEADGLATDPHRQEIFRLALKRTRPETVGHFVTMAQFKEETSCFQKHGKGHCGH